MPVDQLVKARERVRVARERAAQARSELQAAERELAKLEAQEKAKKLASKLTPEEKEILRKHLED